VFSASLTPLNQRAQTQNSFGDFAERLNQEFWMKKIILIVLAVSPVAAVSAQELTPVASSSPASTVSSTTPATAGDVEALRQQVQSLTETVKALQQQVKDQQAALEKANLTGESGLPSNPEPSPIAGAQTSPSPAASASPRFPTEDMSVVASTTAPAASPAPGASPSILPGSFPTTDTSVVTSAPETISTTGAGASLTQPITIGGGKAYMNISLDSVFALAYSSAANLHDIEVGDHDPQQRGFNARNTELAFDGAVDPYFQGFANIVFLLDNDNQTEVELEEAFLQTSSLPYNLQLKAGQFFADFGRLNPTHPHTWDFADSPLINGLFLGPDGLRGVGAQASWTLPLPWYSQLVFASQNGRGETGFSFRNPGDNGMFFDRITTDREARGLQDFVWLPRFENSFNLNDTQTVLAGVSGAFGSNETGANSRTQIYGADLLYKWKSSHAEGGFPFVKWQTEFMYRRFQAGHGADDSFPVAETFHDWGMYSQVLWGFKKGWVAGIRGDYVHMQDSMFTDDLDRQPRWRLSANLTWYPTEFSKIRLQYNQDFLEQNFFLSAREVESVFLQWEFILGAHGAHKF
jgi:TolA-binding protein